MATAITSLSLDHLRSALGMSRPVPTRVRRFIDALETEASLQVRVGRRASRLARALEAVVKPGDGINVLCCETHVLDLVVAAVAGLAVRCQIAAIAPCEVASASRTPSFRRAAISLACEEGTATWMQHGCHGRLVGEGPFVQWWKLFERGSGSDYVAASDLYVGDGSRLDREHDIADLVRSLPEAVREDADGKGAWNCAKLDC